MKRIIAILTVYFGILISVSYSASITITSPNGGEVWAGCTQKTITWVAVGTSNNYSIDYTTDGGASWVSVTSSLYITNGTYTWTVPNINSTNCRIRIIDSNSPSVSDISDNTFSITAPLLLLAPNGGEVWQAGSSKNITWLANGTSNYYNISYSTNAGSTWTSIVTNQNITNQTYNWTVPNYPSSQCLVRIQDYSNTSCMVDISDNLFTISPPTPVITVTFPNSATTLYAGNTYNITWSSAYVTSNLVKIEYSVNGGALWIPITTSTSNSGSFLWNVPFNISNQCLIKVTDLSNPNTYDQSDVMFSIASPFITVTSPNGSESWQGCSSKSITWTSGGASGTFGIYYSTNNGQSWSYLGSSTSSSYTWSSVPNISSSSCLVKVQDYNNSSIKDSSDNQFSITPNNDIIITVPNGGEQWEAGTTKTISWVSAPSVSTFSVYYSLNNGSTWSTITTQTSSKTLNWSVPNSPTNIALIKVSDYSNSCKSDVSDAVFSITPPTPVITVTYPNSNITAYSGNSITIQWTSSYVSDNYVKIEFTADDGLTWQVVANPTENDGSHTWNLPSVNSLQCRFRVSSYQNNNIYDESDVNFKVLPPFITVTSPNGGESWKGCQSKTITWTSGGTSGTFGIYYSINNGLSWTYLANTSSSSYTWSQVSDVGTSNNCLIKVQDYNNSSIKDSSDAVFTITKNSDIIVTAPNGGEQWEVGTTKTISWVSEPTTTRYIVSYSVNGGSSWSTISSSTYSTTQTWTIPNQPNNVSLIRVQDYNNTCIQDVSNSYFSITPPQPVITVTYPNSNITTYSNNSITIQWTSSYVSSSFVKIEFTSDNGATWQTVAEPTENDGSHLWTLPNINSLQCRFRVSEYNNPTVNDESDINFKVLPPFITVTSPNGGESWKGCQSKTITWTSGGTSGTFGIYYSINNGLSWTYLANTSNSSYTWSQVSDVGTSNNCLIKVQDYNNSSIKDSSDAVFTITKNSDIIVTAPNGGEQWEVGTTKTISWVSEPTTTRYIVSYSVNGGSSWSTISSSTYSTTQTWTIPNQPNNVSLIRVQDYNNTCIQDVSNSYFSITPPQPVITVTYPNSNITTYSNNSITIQWTSSYVSSSFVKIEFTSDNGATWQTVAEPTENDGSYAWTLPNINSLQCRFRVSEYNNPSVNDESDVNFKVLPPFITVTSPNGGESWKGCQSKTITWTSGGTSGTFGIYYSINNGVSWTYLANTSSSSYTWSQVSDVGTSNNCLIKVQDYNNSSIKDSSDAVFTLLLNDDIIVSSPNGGEQWQAGSTQTISWVSAATSTRFNVQYSINNGSTWSTLTSSTYNKTLNWQIPNTPSANCLVKVTDYDNTCIKDISNGLFQITQGTPSVTYPNGGESFYYGSSYNITWTSEYFYSNYVSLSYSIDSGFTWQSIAWVTNNSGSYTWNVPNSYSNNCLIKVSEYNNPQNYDISNAVFSIKPGLIVTSPNGDNGFEEWRVCTQTTIKWTSGGGSGSYKIEYSVNNGQSWVTIVSSYSSSGSTNTYNWTIPNTPSTQCLIRITDNSYPLKTDISDATFSIKPAIIVTTPNGGESLQPGSNYNITWQALGSTGYYNIDYSTNGGTSWTNIVYNQNIPSNSYSWLVPAVSSTNCLIKVTDFINTCKNDVSNFSFSIGLPAPAITVISPNGGEILTGCNIYNISWLPSGTSNNFDIEYSSDSGMTWNVIASNYYTTTFTYQWNVPNIQKNKCLIRIKDTNNGGVTDVSNNVFSINQGLSVNVTPSGNTSFCTGGSVTLTSSSASGNVWYPGGETTQSITVSSTGMFYVTVNSGGCVATSNTVAVNVTSIPPAPLASCNNPLFTNGTLYLSASTVPNASYYWTGPNNFTSIQQNPVITNINASHSGIYSVVAVVNSCQSSASTINVVISNNPATAAISGNVFTENGFMLDNVNVKINGTNYSDSIITSASGHYNFNVIQGGSYQITPSKTDAISPTAGLSTLDILLIQRHILNIQPLSSPYKIIAADVNQSGSVSTMDILLIKSLILQNTSSFPNNAVWKFVNTDFVFGNPYAPFPYESSRSYSYATDAQNQNFIGIKLGDVNNSWLPNQTKNSNSGNITIEINNQKANYGDILEVPVKVSNFNQISGYQFTIEWNINDFEFVGVENNALSGSFGLNFVSQGKLSTLWNSDNSYGVSLNDGSALFKLILKVKNSAYSQSPIEINSSITQSKAFNTDLEELDIVYNQAVLTINEYLSVNSSAEAKDVFEVYPNPVNRNTVVEFYNPANQIVSFYIYDIMGKEILRREEFYEKGLQRIMLFKGNIDENSLKNGQYLFRLKYGNEYRSRKIVMINF